MNATMPTPSSGSRRRPSSGDESQPSHGAEQRSAGAQRQQGGAQVAVLTVGSAEEVGRCERQPARAQETGQWRQHAQERKRPDPYRSGGTRDHERRHSDSEQGADSSAKIG